MKSKNNNTFKSNDKIFNKMTDKKPIESLCKTSQTPCQYFQDCGGCELQHLTYQEQLVLKQNTVQTALESGLKELANKLPTVARITPSATQFAYRNSIRLKVCPKTNRLGFSRKQTNEIISIEQCSIAEQNLNATLNILSNLATWRVIAHYAKEILIANSPLDQKTIIGILPKQGLPPQKCISIFGKIIEEHDIIKGVIVYPYKKRGDLLMLDEALSIGELKRYFAMPKEASGTGKDEVLMAGIGAFVQSNWEINLKIIQTMREKLTKTKYKSILDFHTGIGNFLIPLSGSKIDAFGCDVTPQAIQDAKENAKKWGKKINLETVTAAQTAINWVNEGKKASVVLLDPPRGGAPELMKYLPKIASDTIIYLSCDISSLAKDLKKLMTTGYSATDIEPFDMFPQTRHVETLCILRRQ